MGYWVVHLKVDATIVELDFDRKITEVVHDSEEWSFKVGRYSVIAIIPRENILYVEWRER